MARLRRDATLFCAGGLALFSALALFSPLASATTIHYVWTCDAGGRGQAGSLGDPIGSQHPTCTTANGAWVQEYSQDSASFDPATLNASKIAEAFGCGFILIATGGVLSLCVAKLVNAIRDI